MTSRSQVVVPPLLAYKTTTDEQFAIQRAVGLLTAQCMERFGVVMTPQEQRREDVAATRQPTATMYGPITLEEATAAAASVPRAEDPAKKAASSPAPDPREAELRTNQTAAGKPSALRDRAGAPVPQFGCGREGFDKLGYQPDHLIIVDDIHGKSTALIMRDSRYLDVNAQWAHCMKDRGFDVRFRHDPAETEAERQSRVEPDVACARAVNYVGIVNAVEVAYQKQLIAQNSATLTAVRENNRLMATRAQEVLRG